MKHEQWSRSCNIIHFELNDFTIGSKINVTHSLFFFVVVSLFVYKIIQLVQLNFFVYEITQFIQLPSI